MKLNKKKNRTKRYKKINRYHDFEKKLEVSERVFNHKKIYIFDQPEIYSNYKNII